jgi:hypothetical protein
MASIGIVGDGAAALQKLAEEEKGISAIGGIALICLASFLVRVCVRRRNLPSCLRAYEIGGTDRVYPA